MCFFKSPKAPPPPPPPPTPESKDVEALRERRRLGMRKGQYISPFAIAATSSMLGNPTPPKTLLGG